MTAGKHTAALETHTPQDDHLGLERLIFFSDAVFAIAITLLTLEIRLPPVEGSLSDAQLLRTLLAIWPRYLGYIISFLVIGIFWIGHHRKFSYIRRYDRNLLLINLLLLMAVAFIPFPTTVISEYGNRTATIFYALSITLVGLLSTALWAYATHRQRLVDARLTPQQKQREMLRSLLMSGVFLLSIGIAFIHADAAKFSWLLIVLLLRRV